MNPFAYVLLFILLILIWFFASTWFESIGGAIETILKYIKIIIKGDKEDEEDE